MRVLLVSKAYVVAEYRRKAAELASLGVDLTLVAPRSWRDERGDTPWSRATMTDTGSASCP